MWTRRKSERACGQDEQGLALLVSLAGDSEQAVVGSALQGLCPALPRLFNLLQYGRSEQADLKRSGKDHHILTHPLQLLLLR